jgi:hypothetical protein
MVTFDGRDPEAGARHTARVKRIDEEAAMRAVAKRKTVREWSDAGAIGSVAEARWQGEQLSFRVDAFLRSRGWEHTSSTPGSYWLWGKTIDGKAFWVDQAHALGIEASQEPDDIDGDEELGG